MHVDSEKDPIETRVQGQCIISCRMIQVVQIMHAIRRGPRFGLCSYGRRNSQLNMGYSSQELCKEIGAQEAPEIG